MSVRVVVLNFNGGELTLRCLNALQALDEAGPKAEIVVVDNASTDGSVEAVRTLPSPVVIIENEINTGFPANNLALHDLENVDYVALLNNDAFPETDWLSELVTAMEADRGLGAVCSKMVLAPQFLDVSITSPGFDAGPLDSRRLGVQVRGVNAGKTDLWKGAHLGTGGWGREYDHSGAFEWAAPRATLRIPVEVGVTSIEVTIRLQSLEPIEVTINGGARAKTETVMPEGSDVTITVKGEPYDVINNVGSFLYEDGAGADRGWLERDWGQYDQPVDVFNWCGGAVLLRPEYLEDVGLFDERFFLYYEDTDLSWRGQARGWRYRTAPKAVVRHVHSASSGVGSAVFEHYVERNRLLLLVKNAPMPVAIREMVRFTRSTASYGLRRVVIPLLHGRRPETKLVRRRVKSFMSFLRLLPAMLLTRRSLRREKLVDDVELAKWFVER